MTCPNCGAPISPEANFCSNCGFNLKTNTNQTNQSVQYNNQYDQVTDWISKNGMVIFVGAIVTMILMSGSITLGWTAFFIDLLLIYWLGINFDGSDETLLNEKVIHRVDQVSDRVMGRLENKTVVGEEPTERQQKVREKMGGINFNFITILISIFSLIIVFYGPFGTQLLMGTGGKSVSIYNALLGFARFMPKNMWLGYSLLTVVLGVPILIIILTLSNKKGANRWSFILSLLETAVLIFVAVQVMRRSVMFDGFGTIGSGQFGSSTVVQRKILGMTIGFGISSYLLLLSSVLLNISTWLNRR